MKNQELTVENKSLLSSLFPKNMESPYNPFYCEGAGNSELKFTGLTKREYACIHLGIPESGDAELDALIRKAERKKIAAMVLQGIAANYQYNPMNVKHFKKATEDAINQAEALLSELEPEKSE